MLYVEYLKLRLDLRSGRGPAAHAERGAYPDHDKRQGAPEHVAVPAAARRAAGRLPPGRPAGQAPPQVPLVVVVLALQAPHRNRAGLPGHGQQAAGELAGVRRYLGERAQLVLDAAQRARLRPAVSAGRQVGMDPVQLHAAELAIDVRGEQFTEMMAHRSRTRRSLSRCARAARSWARPRWMRLRTVPSLTPMVAAISS